MAKICPVTNGPVLYLDCRDCDEKENGFVKAKLDTLIAPIRDKYRFLIVSGGANGVDTLAERYTKENSFELCVMPADWKRYGKRAGYIRNDAMHRYISGFEHRGCAAFWDGQSKGTLQSRQLAEKYENPLRFILTKK